MPAEKQLNESADALATRQFLDGLKKAAVSGDKQGKILDSASFDSDAANEFATESLSRSGAPMTEHLTAILDSVDGDGRSLVLQKILDSASNYEYEHGVEAPSDYLAHVAAMGASPILDSASNTQSDSLSLQPDRLVIAILSATAEPIPFAFYLPTDIGSNQSRTSIVSHLAGTKTGAYGVNDSLDGIGLGNTYLTGARRDSGTVATVNTAVTGQLTTMQDPTDPEKCITVGNGATALKLYRGRTVVYVNGQYAGGEVTTNQNGSGSSSMVGQIKIGATTHNFTGTVNTDNGTWSLVSATLPVGTKFSVKGFINFELQPEIAPSIKTMTEEFNYYYGTARGNVQVTPESLVQFRNELNLDPMASSLVTVNNHFAMERHYAAIYEALIRAKSNPINQSYDFNWSTRGAQLNRGQIMADSRLKLSILSQAMAESTFGVGVSHMYVGKNLASVFESLPADYFQPSGIQKRAGVYRLGRWMNDVEIYYLPRFLSDSASASEALCIGRAPDAARNVVVTGDSTAPLLTPTGVNLDQLTGYNFFAKYLIEQNKHQPSANAAAMLNFTNLNL